MERRILFLMFCWAVIGPTVSINAERRTLPGHLPAPVRNLPGGTHLHPTNSLELALGLALRNPEALTNLLQELYDPTRATYGQFLTPEDFTEQFGPSESDFERVRDFATTNGLRVIGTPPNRMFVRVRGSVATIERALGIQLLSFPHPTEARRFFAPDREPSIDRAVPVLHISGLNDYTRPRAHYSPRAGGGRANGAVPQAGSGPTGSFMGLDFRKAYVPGTTLTGSNQAVGLFELDGYYASDIAAYETQAGLPSVLLQNVLIDGFSGVPTSRTPGSPNEEVALDIEMVISMAPGLSRVIVYEGSPNASASTLNHILNRMATDNLAKQLSCSWGFDIDAITQQIFLQYAAQGQSFFLASGDSGAFVGPVLQPSDNPNITVVGGTVLTTSSTGAWQSETAWSGSSGGISTLYPIPSWQQGISMASNLGSTTARNTPDIAMVGSDVWVIADQGRSFAVNGTSIAAPLWAGFTAMVNQQGATAGLPPVGFLNPSLYRVGRSLKYASTFHDISSGNNHNASSPVLFPAAIGFDLVTGWGTPRGTNLINALLTAPDDPLVVTPPLGLFASGPVHGPLNVASENFVLTNVGTSAVTWSLVNTSSWLRASATNGTLDPGGRVSLTVGLNPSVSNVLMGRYTGYITFTNETTGVSQNRYFTMLLGNGSFETGDFANWTFAGSASGSFADSIDLALFNGHQSVPGVDDSAFVHSGSFGAFLGQTATLGSLTQSIPTVAGQHYLLSFWYTCPVAGTPNELRASWNGAVLFDRLNVPATPWTNQRYIVAATAASSSLQFAFRNDPNALGLDDVSITPLIRPILQRATQSNGVFAFTWSAVPGVSYQVQTTTDLVTKIWSNLGTPVTAGSNELTISEAPDTSALRFYRLIISP